MSGPVVFKQITLNDVALTPSIGLRLIVDLSSTVGLNLKSEIWSFMVVNPRYGSLDAALIAFYESEFAMLCDILFIRFSDIAIIKTRHWIIQM